MKTCGTCKHFGELVNLDSYDPSKDDVDLTNTRLHECNLLKHLNGKHPYNVNAVAGVIDGSGYHATFCVNDEFGCNQHAERTGG